MSLQILAETSSISNNRVKYVTATRSAIMTGEEFNTSYFVPVAPIKGVDYIGQQVNSQWCAGNRKKSSGLDDWVQSIKTSSPHPTEELMYHKLLEKLILAMIERCQSTEGFCVVGFWPNKYNPETGKSCKSYLLLYLFKGENVAMLHTTQMFTTIKGSILH